jgi:Cu+-exporting ATPase
MKRQVQSLEPYTGRNGISAVKHARKASRKTKPSVTDVIGVRGQAADDVLRLAAVVEKGSEHPLGRAVLQAAMLKGLSVPDASSFKAVPGEGVVVEYNAQTLLLGNRKLMAEYKVGLREVEAQLGILESDGKTVMVLSNEKEPLGLIGLADTLKDESGQAVQELQRLKIEVILMTGDNQRTGKAIAAKLGINKVIAYFLSKKQQSSRSYRRREESWPWLEMELTTRQP